MSIRMQPFCYMQQCHAIHVSMKITSDLQRSSRSPSSMDPAIQASLYQCQHCVKQQGFPRLLWAVEHFMKPFSENTQGMVGGFLKSVVYLCCVAATAEDKRLQVFSVGRRPCGLLHRRNRHILISVLC